MLADQARNAPLTRPRPGHADLAGMQKYGHDGRPARCSSAPARGRRPPGWRSARWPGRTCASRSASRSSATWWRSATVARPTAPCRGPDDARARGRRPGALPRPGGQRGDAWPRSTPPARTGDTLGGVVEVLAYGVPPGLGSHVHWDRRLDARLAGALMSIQAIEGRRGRRRLRHRPRAAGRRPTTRSRPPTTGSGGAPTGPAASRAA